MTSALLLNADMSPLTTVSLKRLIGLMLGDKVDIIEEIPDEYIRSPHTSMKFPSVIRLKRYVSVPRRGAQYSRRGVLIRDNYTCVYCGQKMSREDATVDHIIPIAECRAKNIRASTWSNVVASCQRCNYRKAHRSLRDAGMRFLDKNFEPKTPRASYLVLGSNIREEWRAYLQYG